MTSTKQKTEKEAFQPIFCRNEDYRKIAFMNWRMSHGSDISSLLEMANGFMSSAIELAKFCIEDNDDHKADALIFPVLTNVNHGIELYLKGMIWTVNELTHTGFKLERLGHNIQEMYHLLRTKLNNFKGVEFQKHFDELTIELRDYIDELFKKIGATRKSHNMDFSRYPMNINYERYFYAAEYKNVEVDLENFINRFELIHKTLENFSSYLYHQEYQGEW